MTKRKSGKSRKYSNNTCREVTVYQSTYRSDNIDNDSSSRYSGRDFYEVLGVDKKATTEEIRSAYKILARRYHPDKNRGNAEAKAKFIEVKRASDVLMDPDTRVIYDRLGMKGLDLAEEQGETSTAYMARFISNPLYGCLIAFASLVTCCCCCGCCCLCCCCCGTLHNRKDMNPTIITREPGTTRQEGEEEIIIVRMTGLKKCSKTEESSR